MNVLYNFEIIAHYTEINFMKVGNYVSFQLSASLL